MIGLGNCSTGFCIRQLPNIMLSLILKQMERYFESDMNQYYKDYGKA